MMTLITSLIKTENEGAYVEVHGIYCVMFVEQHGKELVAWFLC